jgi:hypothetical protein
MQATVIQSESRVALLKRAVQEERADGFVKHETRSRLYMNGYDAVTLERDLIRMRDIQ